MRARTAFPLLLTVLLVGCGVPKEQHEKLQAELTAKNVELEKHISDLSTTGAEIAKHLSVITTLKQELEATRDELKKAQADLEETRASLSKANVELARKAKLPIKVGFRKSALGDSLVGQFSVVCEEVPVRLTISRPVTGQEKIIDSIFKASAMTEIGHLEGWAFRSGDQIAVHNSNFERIELTVP